MFYRTAASVIGRQSDQMSLAILIICLVLFGIITGLMLYFSLRYGRKRHPEAADIKGSALLETGWSVGAVVIVLFLFFLGWGVYASVRGDAPQDAYEVRATAQMWSWSFEYPDGRQSAELMLPEGRPVKVVLASNDVIHSFYVPAFRVKQDAVPGFEKSVWFTPDRKGAYDLFCTEYCGYGHSQMLTKAVVMGEKEFSEWGAPQVAAGRAPDEIKEKEAAAEEKPVEEAVAGDAELAKKGEQLIKSKGCIACHSVDGSKRVGPTFKGVFGSKVKVKTDGKEREVTADVEYIKKSMTEPNADVVVGFPAAMPPQKLSDADMDAIIAYIKTLK